MTLANLKILFATPQWMDLKFWPEKIFETPIYKNQIYLFTQTYMKTDKIIFWITTILIFALISLPAVMFNGEMSKEGIKHLGFPPYFNVELGIAKILGGFVLIIPQIPSRLKEWAYVGFGIDFISAFIAIYAVDGFSHMALLPIVALLILAVSYKYFHKLESNKKVV